MKIFGTADINFFPITSVNYSRTKLIYGAWVGAENFYHALLKFGTFDEYHFFVNSKLGAQLLKKRISRFNLSLDKIKIININELPAYLQKINYTVFFTIGLHISKLAYVRAQYAKKYFPICGIAFHTLSYPQYLEGEFFENMIHDLHPFDSIICTTHAAYRAIQNLYSLVSRSFQKKTGLALRYNGRLDYLPFGINADEYRNISKLEARKLLGLARDKIIILYFGRFSLYDKADLYPLLVAFKEILSQRRNVMLLLAGVDTQGKYGAKLQRISKEMGLSSNVRFILRNCLKEKNAFYAAGDIFVSPSDNIQETFGLTILEAMASGLPVVGSDWNGYKDLIIHNETGFRVPTYWKDCKIEDMSPFSLLTDSDWQHHLYLAQSVSVDVKKLTEYLSILIKNKDLRLRIGENARNMVLKKYDWKVVIPSYEKLWQKLSQLPKGQTINKVQKELFMPKYFYSFRHYPTRILDSRTKITISKSGLLFLKTRKLPFKIEKELKDVITIGKIFMILSFLYKKNSTSIAQVEKYIKKILKVKVHIIRYNIMWLLKKDLLILNSAQLKTKF